MAGQIARYHVADFGTVKAATTAAAALIEYLSSPKGLRHRTGPRRAVVWGESLSAPPLDQACLYLSDGALEAARELDQVFTLRSTITAEELPGTRKLILGDGVS